MDPLLSILDLSVDFISSGQRSSAVRNCSFSITRGEIVALVGESGSGKSVTSLSILQLLPSPPAIYANGQILFTETGSDPVDLLTFDQATLQRIRGNRISMIFQEPMTSLNPVFTCGDQVAEAIRSHHHLSAAEARGRAIEWFRKVQLPDPADMFGRYPHQLSGGQKQRVMIAMAMCCEPALLICDEPTTALDVTVQKNILTIIRDLQQETGMGVLFITHDLGVVAEIADRTIVLYRGSIVEQNTTRALFLQPQHPYTRGLLACRPALHEKGERLPVVSDFLRGDNTNNVTTAEDVTTAAHVTTAHDADTALKTPKPPPSMLSSNARPEITKPILLSVQHLSVHFPGTRKFFGKTPAVTKAVDDVSFDLYENETLGLVGESGCGKTTLGRTLLKLIEPTAGEIIYQGRKYSGYSADDVLAMRRKMQLIFQDPYSSLNPRMSIGHAIAEPLRVHRLVQGEAARRDRVRSLLQKVGLSAEHFNRYPHEFSGGQRQRIVIARALAMEPSFIVCDESVSALDVSIQAQILNLLNDLRSELKFTVVFISHDLSVVKYIADRMLVMNHGRIEEAGDAAEIYRNPRSAYTRKLIDSIPAARFD